MLKSTWTVKNKQTTATKKNLASTLVQKDIRHVVQRSHNEDSQLAWDETMNAHAHAKKGISFLSHQVSFQKLYKLHSPEIQLYYMNFMVQRDN